MLSRKGIALTLLVFLFAALSAHAEQPLATKIENAIGNAEPDWRCTKGILNGPPPLVASRRVLLESVWNRRLDSGKRETVHIEIFQVDSFADAKMSLGPVREGKVTKGWSVQRFTIGDEGYLATFAYARRFEIQFRKGTYIAKTSSASRRTVERFADIVAAQIDGK